MKVGTDSVLLGCLCEAENAKRILDIGTGTGLLALMLAQKSNAVIDAVELDKKACDEAKYNFHNSAWSSRLHIHHSPVQLLQTVGVKYDLIISNPPYYQHEHHMSIADEQRNKARHDKDLPFDVLCDEVSRLLDNSGAFWLILPVAEARELRTLALKKGFFLTKEIFIYPKESKPYNRIIMCFTKLDEYLEQRSLIIYRDDNNPTDEYIRLVNDYYLWRWTDHFSKAE